MKPTYGTVSRFGLVAYASSMDQIGSLCKNVEDSAVVLEAISSSFSDDPENCPDGNDWQEKTQGNLRNSKDSTCLGRRDTNFTAALKKEIKGMRIGILRDSLALDLFGEGLDSEVRGAILDAAELLRGNGAVVEEVDFPLLKYAVPAYYTIASAEAGSNLQRFDGIRYGCRAESAEGLHEMYKKTRSRGFGEEVKRRIMLGSFVLSSGYYDAYYLKALRVKAVIKKAFDEIFEKYDCILGPTAPVTAPKLGESLPDPLKMYLGDIYTIPANLAGLPGISIPCGADSRGLPIGLQLTGDCFQEKKLLQTAYTYEKLREEAAVCQKSTRPS